MPQTDLAKLVHLQACEKRLAEIQRARTTAPEVLVVRELTERSQKFAKLEQVVRQRLAGAERVVRKMEMALAASEEARDGVQARLYSGEVTHPKELTQLEARRAELEGQIEKEEEQLLAALEGVDNLKAQMAKVEAGAAKTDSQLRVAKERLAHRQSEWDLHEAMLEAEIEGVRSEIDATLLAMYERKRATTRGEPIATVRRGVCGGCGMKLPTSVKAVQGRKIATCEHCGRLLYWPE